MQILPILSKKNLVLNIYIDATSLHSQYSETARHNSGLAELSLAQRQTGGRSCLEVSSWLRSDSMLFIDCWLRLDTPAHNRCAEAPLLSFQQATVAHPLKQGKKTMTQGKQNCLPKTGRCKSKQGLRAAGRVKNVRFWPDVIFWGEGRDCLFCLCFGVSFVFCFFSCCWLKFSRPCTSGLDMPDASLGVLAGALRGTLSASLCDRKRLVLRTVSPRGDCRGKKKGIAHTHTQKKIKVPMWCDSNSAVTLWFMHFVLSFKKRKRKKKRGKERKLIISLGLKTCSGKSASPLDCLLPSGVATASHLPPSNPARPLCPLLSHQLTSLCYVLLLLVLPPFLSDVHKFNTGLLNESHLPVFGIDLCSAVAQLWDTVISIKYGSLHKFKYRLGKYLINQTQ